MPIRPYARLPFPHTLPCSVALPHTNPLSLIPYSMLNFPQTTRTAFPNLIIAHAVLATLPRCYSTLSHHSPVPTLPIGLPCWTISFRIDAVIYPFPMTRSRCPFAFRSNACLPSCQPSPLRAPHHFLYHTPHCRPFPRWPLTILSYAFTIRSLSVSPLSLSTPRPSYAQTFLTITQPALCLDRTMPCTTSAALCLGYPLPILRASFPRHIFPSPLPRHAMLSYANTVHSPNPTSRVPSTPHTP